jgi:hypothetical protein
LKGCVRTHLPELRRAERGGNAFGQLFESHSFRNENFCVFKKYDILKTDIE